MKDFGRWLAEQCAQAIEITDDELPDGLYRRYGKVWATCRSCEKDYEVQCDPKHFSQDMSYCGGSQHCLP
jgi:hypothetical protein